MHNPNQARDAHQAFLKRLEDTITAVEKLCEEARAAGDLETARHCLDDIFKMIPIVEQVRAWDLDPPEEDEPKPKVTILS